MRCTLSLKYVYYLLLRYDPSPYTKTSTHRLATQDTSVCSGIRRTLSEPTTRTRTQHQLEESVRDAHQYTTNQHYVKSDAPYDPGLVDAFTHDSIGAGGFVYAHLFTDLASRQVYPEFTKSKLEVELTEMMSKLFFAHPEWKSNGTAIDRMIKVDIETGSQSEDFKEYCYSLGYRIETSPTRDKHAHSVAERSVGNIVTKANISMMGNINNPCPLTYWPDAIQYACHCDGFGYKSKMGTGPYF